LSTISVPSAGTQSTIEDDRVGPTCAMQVVAPASMKMPMYCADAGIDIANIDMKTTIVHRDMTTSSTEAEPMAS